MHPTPEHPIVNGTLRSSALVPPRRRGPDGQMRTPDQLATDLRRRWHGLSAEKPTCATEVRQAAWAILTDVGSRLAELQVRVAVTRRPLDWRFLPDLEHCQRELDLIAPLWARSTDAAEDHAIAK